MKRARTLGLIVGMVVVAGSAAAQAGEERRPVAEEVLKPITVKRSVVPASAEARRAALKRLLERPLMTPLGRANSPENLDFKKRVASDPRVQAADQALDFSGPTAQAAASVTESFRGINIFEAGVFRGNTAFFRVPPDPQVAASPQRVVHVVNVAIRMFNRQGGAIQRLDLNDFFGTPIGENGIRILFDPKVIFDVNAANKRFYVVALETTAGTPPPNRSRIHLAVSRSPNPANLNPGNWCFYNVNAVRDSGTSLESWADFPGLGAGADALVITANQFTFADFFFTHSVIRAIRKLPLSNNANGCPSPRLFTFEASEEVGDIVTGFTVQPVQHLTSPSSFPGTSKPTYLINSIFSAATSVPQRDYFVYRLRNVATSSPTLSRTTVTGNFAYFIPPNVPQDNEFGTIITNADDMLEAAGVGDAFWAGHSTACGFPSGNVTCARVIRVRVGQSPGGALRAAITQQSTFGAPDEFLWMPGIAVNRDETVAVPFHFASPDRTNNNLSTWWAVKNLNETAFRPLRPLTTGVCQQVVFRTGDYSGAETDPVDLKSFWLSGERARRIPEFGNDCLWETRIIRVTPGGSGGQVAAAESSEE
jgi:hypothetical protein